jgi:hypothetical protein
MAREQLQVALVGVTGFAPCGWEVGCEKAKQYEKFL